MKAIGIMLALTALGGCALGGVVSPASRATYDRVIAEGGTPGEALAAATETLFERIDSRVNLVCGALDDPRLAVRIDVIGGLAGAGDIVAETREDAEAICAVASAIAAPALPPAE